VPGKEGLALVPRHAPAHDDLAELKGAYAHAFIRRYGIAEASPLTPGKRGARPEGLPLRGGICFFEAPVPLPISVAFGVSEWVARESS
jgi:hypothetical protein